MKLPTLLFKTGLTALAVLVADQVTKQFVLHSAALRGLFSLTSWCAIEVSFNKGISFGIGNQPAWHVVIMAAVVVVQLIIGYGWYCAAVAGKLPARAYGLACMLGGGISNFIDRVHYAAVVDFIVLHYRGWVFPTFNVADACICLGAALVVWAYYEETSS